MRQRARAKQKDVLRTLVLDNGGRMGKSNILNNKKFRGWDKADIGQMVYMLRKENKGYDWGRGMECWELIGASKTYLGDVVGLESKLHIAERRKISGRRASRQVGSGEQSVLDNTIFASRIKKEITDGRVVDSSLKASSKDLGLVVKSSGEVKDALDQHKDEFEPNP